MKRGAEESRSGSPVIQLMLHLCDGAVPLLTPTLLRKGFASPQPNLILGVAIRDTCLVPIYDDNNHQRRSSKHNTRKPVGFDFVPMAVDSHLSGYQKILVPTFDPIDDGVKAKHAQGMNATNEKVFLWTPHGRHPLSADDYVRLSAEIKTDFTVPLFDVALDSDVKKRRFSADLRRTSWSKKHLNESPASSRLLFPLALTGSAHGVVETENVKAQVGTLQPNGYAIDGFSRITSRATRRRRLAECIQRYRAEPVVLLLLSVNTVEQFIDGLRAGCCIIGTSLPAKWANENKAVVICTNYTSAKALKKGDSSEAMVKPTITLDTDGCMDLANKTHERDSQPILESCCCLACCNHSRAYIHHLVKANELLAKILLMIHNLHQMIELCRIATEALSESEDSLMDFCQFVEDQFS